MEEEKDQIGLKECFEEIIKLKAEIMMTQETNKRTTRMFKRYVIYIVLVELINIGLNIFLIFK